MQICTYVDCSVKNNDNLHTRKRHNVTNVVNRQVDLPKNGLS